MFSAMKGFFLTALLVAPIGAPAAQPKSFEESFHRGVAALRAGRFPEAVQHFEAALEKNPGHPQSRFHLARALREQGEAERAVELLTGLESSMPDALFYFVLGRTLADTGRLKEAETALRKSARLRPDAARTHYQLGEVLADEERWIEALQAIEEASRRQAEWVQPYKRLGELRLRIGDPVGAIESLERAREIAPGAPLILAVLGDAYAASGRFDDAVDAYQEALSGRADMPLLRARLANALLASGAEEEALEAYARAVRDAPEDVSLRTARAVALVATGRESEGAAELERVLAREPTNGIALYYLGVRDSEAGFERRARERLSAAIEALARERDTTTVPAGRGGEEYPVTVAARVALAELLLGADDPEAAIATLEDVLDAEPDHATALYLMGMARRRTGDREASRAALERFQQVNDAREHDQLALQALSGGDEARAAEELEEALRIYPGDPIAHWHLARLALARGDDEEAARHLGRAITARPRFEKAYTQWMLLLCRQGRIDEARKLLEEARTEGLSLPSACVPQPGS